MHYIAILHSHNFENNCARDVVFGSDGGGNNSEHNDVGLGVISRIFATQDDVCLCGGIIDGINIPCISSINQ